MKMRDLLGTGARKDATEKRMAAPVGNGTANAINPHGNESGQLYDTSRAALQNDVSRVLRKLNRCERATSELYALAREACKTKHRFAIQEWAEWVRAHDVTDSNGNPFTISNSDCAIVARLLLEHIPECRPYVELRSSRYDVCFHDPYGGVEA